jgi:hypothetical protein
MHHVRPATRLSPVVIRVNAIGLRLCPRRGCLSTADADDAASVHGAGDVPGPW